MNVILNDLIRSSHKALITLLFAFVSYHGFSQPLGGAYTIGSGGNYATIAEAVADVTAKGVSGPVVFRLETGTFTEQVTIGPISGTSATNTITFEAESGNAQDAVLSFAPTNTENHVIRLDNASFITFRNLSIETSGTSYTRAVHGVNNLNNITFEGLRITLPSTTSATENLGAIILRPTLSTNIRFLNNTITGGSHGILHIGNTSARSSGTVFTGNSVTNVYYRPVHFQYMQDIIFNNNTITYSGTAYSDYHAVGIENTSGYLEMTRNRITGTVGHALRLAYFTGIEAQPSLIANNFFHSNSSYGTVYIYYSLHHTNFYHNSVNNTSSGEALYFNRGQSEGNRFVNNIFKANAGYAVEFQTSSTANSIVEADYNNLFTSGSFIGRDGSTNIGTLSSWQTATNLEANSVSYDPQYQSSTALYASAPGIASAGRDLMLVVPSDIDNVARTTTPSLGATQFSAAALVPLSGTYTIGTGAFDFTTISAAIDAMKVNGIGGPVTFLLNSETFTERFMLPSVSGMSSANPIIFESQSGNPDDVIFTPPAATDAASNYIVRLSNAAFVTFRNVTFQPAAGTNFTRAIHVVNRADDLTFENLRINLPATTSVTEERGAIIARTSLSSNIRFINNTITGGSHGIIHVGNSSSRSPGTVFTGNTITNVHARPVYFQYMRDIIFNNNTITYSGTAYSDYHAVGIENTSGYLEMTRNRITGTVGHALRLAYFTGTQAQPSIIANNFFHSNSSYGTVYIYYSLYHTNFYHNSVNNTSSGEALYFNRGQSEGNRFVNNIFKANAGYAVEFQTSSTANSIVEADYNNLFTSGSFIGRDGSTNIGTLSSWQTATNLEANSVSYDPQYQSSTALYASAPGIASAGRDLMLVVPSDIDNVARTTTPSLGATQFSAAALVPLSGTYTIGTGAFDFTTISAAIDAMKVNGIGGPVTFLLNSETFTERFMLPSVSGMSSANPIIFESQSGNPDDVIFTPPAATDAASNYIVRLSNAAFVTFRNVTFQPAAGTNFTRAIHVVNRADDLTFENLRINLPATTSVTEERGAIIARTSLSSNIRFINNTITGGSHGIIHVGNSSSRSPGTVFTGNTITNVHARPVYFQYMRDIIFNNNTITYSGTAYSDYHGVGIENTSGYLEMTRNRITGAVGHALRLAYFTGIEAQPSLIANNFFHSNSSYGTVYIYYSLHHTNFYHNSVNNTSSGEALYFNRGQSEGNRFVNNIFKANAGYAVEFQTSSTANSIVEADYNNLFTSGSFIGRDGSTNIGTLSSWQTATNLEANSVSYDPQYQSSTALYASAPGIASAGRDLMLVVPSDIDNVARTTTPSLGATQFSAAALVPLSGTYTIGTGAFDFTTISAAIDAMKVNGIGGPVTFLLNSETFTERFMLPSVSGMSSANPIIFESQSGNPDDVIFTPPAATDAAGNYIVRLSNAAFVTFQNVTFQPAAGTNFTRAIHVVNRADDLTFENLRINLPATASVTEERGAIIARTSLSSNIRFINNTITGGSHGIIHVGNSSSRSPGTVFTGNTITNVHARPVYFQYMRDIIFNNNTITYSGTAYSDYHGVGIENTSGYLEMTRNRITGAVGHALRLAYFTGIEAQPSLIANNFFHSNSSYGTVYIYYSLHHTNFYHNSVNNTSSGEALYFNRGQSEGNRFVNNIFKANAGYAVEFQTSSTANSIVEADYNNLFTSGSFIGRDGSTNIGTLSSWQTATNLEANSVSYDPQYQSSTALYASAPGIASAGRDLMLVVPSDIDNVARTTTPSLGATQFSAAALVPLSGTYTIGTGAFDFTTISAAIDAMKVNGIGGPVTFLLNSETFTERFMLPSVSGMSSANPIIFESQSGNPDDVIFTPPAATDAASNYIVRLSNAAFVTFRNVTFQPAAGTNFTRAIHVVNRADDLTFENLRINLPATTSVTEERGAIIARTSLSSNIRFINNTITGGSHGIIHVGNSSSRSPGTVFTGNTITNVHARPVYFQYMRDIIFNNNTITYSGTAYSDYHGVGIENTSGYLEMTRNRITGAVGHALRLAYFTGIEAQPSLIANNFFHSNSSYGTVYIYYSLHHTNFYHNSVNNTSSGEALYFNRGQSEGNRFVNNIFKANAGYAVEFQTSSTANSIVEADYNNLFTSGSFIGRDGSTNIGTLSSWQTATNLEANSVSIDPQFVSNTDLHTSVSALSAAGKNVNAQVPDDINGVARPSTPSLGAVQFGASGTPLNGAYTIDAAGSGATNFTTFAGALDALKNFGIDGPVVFKVNGQFSEQLTFLAVSGSSSTNTVTFESATGQTGDAIIRFASNTSGANFTIRLSNADHHRFRNLTIIADGATYSCAVHAINRTVDIIFEGNVIESTVTTATSSDRGGILIASAQSQNVHLLNNTFRNGSFGIQFTGPTTRAMGTVIRGNIIDKAYYRGIRLTYQTGSIIDQNQVLNNPSSTGFHGIEISSIDGVFEITANKVTGGNGTALSLSSALAPDGSPALIANNFLQTNNGSGYQTVYLNYLRNVNIYHNNINATGPGNGFYYTSTSGQNINFVNNIIKATQVAVYIASPAAIDQIDHNDYYTTGTALGYWGASEAADLSAWQALTGQEANSFSVDPQYQSVSNLEALASSLAGAGLDLTAIVPNDINGVARTIPVSIGASQYTAAFSLDGTISRIITPVSSCSLTDAEDVRIEITNLGALAISGFKVAYKLNTETPVEENIPGAVTIGPGAKYEHTFAQKINLSAKETYTLKAYIILPGEENTDNDTLTTTITHYPDLVTTLTDNTTICNKEPVTLTATGGVQYVWDTGANAASITVSPTVTTTYAVLITNANGCKETREVTVTVRGIPAITFTNDPGYTASYVSPLQGSADALFDFRMIYTEANGNMPASGYPRVELDANSNGQATDPLDIVRAMQEANSADTDVTDGKEYRVNITNLADNIAWRSRIVALNSDGCQAETPFMASPSVSNDLLDAGIYANDISFSKSNPAINESFKIYARIHNTSDYLAENFVVTAYINEAQVFTRTVIQLNPQSSITLQWDQSFPASGFYPVKVVVDETNVLKEDNELNNFAIRPVITGDYELPGGIDITATADPLALQPRQILTLTGTAQYFGIDPAVDPDVAGATAIARITGGAQAQTTTQPDGSYTISLPAPVTPGTYSVKVEITDYTLTGHEGPIEFTVLPPPPGPDLSTLISLDRNTIIAGEQISGMVVLQNIGDATATNFLFRYFNCDEVLGEEQIASLAPGESRTYTFTTTPTVIGDCFNRTNCLFRSVADVNNQVVEKTKTNNQSSAYLTVLPGKPDLTPLNLTNSVIPGNINMLNPFTFSVRVDNIGGVNATTPFTVSVYVDEVLVRSEPIPLLNTCDGNTFSVTHDFGGDTGDKVLTIKVDEPIGSGSVDEYRETNNEFSKIIRHLPPSERPNLNISNKDISVLPVLPTPGSAFDILFRYRNNGTLAIQAPFNVEMTVTEAGSPRIVTQTINETILPGGSRDITLNASLATDGDHAVLIRLDSDNVITEGSEGDNIAQMPLCTDFSVSPIGNVWGSFYVNTLQHLTARLYNHGLFTGADVSVSFYLNDVKIASTVVPVVESTIDVPYYSVSIPHVFDEAGTFQLKVVVDDPAAYTECREDNNEYNGQIEIRMPAPDVRVFSEYISPTRINPDVNEPITIFLSYDNAGLGESGPFKARILVDDVPLGADMDIPSIAAGDDGTVEIPTPYSSATAGIRVIRAILDPDNQLTETTRLNNEATRALVVGKAPNLFFTDLQPNINCPDDGSDVVITATVYNDGDVQATAELVFYYIAGADTIPIENKSFTLAGKESTTLQTQWLVINKTYDLYAAIRASDPLEFDESDNTILTELCGGPYYNLFVEAEGQGIIQKTPNMNRYEGAQEVTVTATPATGWMFAGWQGDVTGSTNPLTLNLTSDQTILAIFSEQLVAPVVTENARCGPGSVALQATGAIGAQRYVWYTQATGGNPIPNETGATFTTPELTASTSYYVAVASVNGEGPRTEVQAIILPLPAQPQITVEGALNCPDENVPTVLQAPAEFAGYMWSTNETTQQIDVISAGNYSVQVVDDNACVSVASPVVTITEESCHEVIVYNAISPENGDKLNNHLIIENVGRLPDTRENKLRVFNRWGDVVFETSNYDNVNNLFTGVTNDGKKLPSGTYFYILEFKSGRKKMAGYISVRR